MSLSSLLASISNTTVGDDQGTWNQFVSDHLDEIAQNSTSYDIAPIVMYKYRYNLDYFLKDNLKRNQDIGWIVRKLNDLPNDFAFDQPGIYVIPTDNYILKLYNEYKTIESNPF